MKDKASDILDLLNGFLNRNKGASMQPTGTVQLYLNGQPIDGAVATLDADGKYSIIYAGLPTGADSVTAVYSGDDNFDAIASQPLVQQVNTVKQQAAVSINSDPNPSNQGQAVTFSGAVTPAA